MGQKIHPLGFRVGITKRHETVWFARFEKRQYAQTVLEDIFLRKTLQQLLPELLKKKYNNSEQVGKIAQIKIERGFIPYEIGIQIHAQNCEAIKTAVDKLELNPNLLQNCLKNQFVLEKASIKSQDVFQLKTTPSLENNLQKSLSKKKKNNSKFENFSSSKKTNRFNLLDKRLKKRKNTLERFRQRILENMLIVKKGKKITRKFQKTDVRSLRSTRKTNDFVRTRQGKNQNKSQRRFVLNRSNTNKEKSKNNQTDFSILGTARLRSILTENREQSQKTTKFMNVFLSKMNRNFVVLLKSEMSYWNSYLENYKTDQVKKFARLRYAPLGYQTKWSLARLKRYEKQPLNVLVKLLKVLQKQALRKLELLRKEFLVLGTLSKMKSFLYFQRIRFIKALKNFIQQSKIEVLAKQKNKLGDRSHRVLSQTLSTQKRLENEKALLGFTEKALKRKFTNLKEENRKVKFVEYLQSIVQKHRQKNLFLYLTTIADSRKYLRQIQKFTKEQASFLFGINKNMLEQMTSEQKRDFVKNQLKKSIQRANRQNELQRSLQDVFVRQIQKQKSICQQNLALTPKISLKFYSVKSEIIETNASIVTDTIVDKLEKREAFRRVIKKVSEDLMKTSKVKGVKIQVSGRLNGAEIARSEWVRAGRVPLQTLRANIDYCYKTAQTIYGIIGVKVWIYKGYTKLNKNA
ncbi:30S ribosomal protein S3, chloroplastic (chloroplast) [Monoraphidium neglectum]|jgi:ribosomal protein S3|uniref:Small ribosomal subunit protein uS3c n=1 Tax=Monoraphidium neglectum TaxID=145388 RepID=A0A0D2MZV8_9CHLO|nr:30S ribosomal protein S3, chloroplastic [Monoraphidium neglectum]KIZ07970.1 30S ribosomal protein S3, chloroplastic [Monoraphidium neglectum]|eukprot:XP_013906989.1 30S ribosomal protein S3, chloroplastic (chloroplast) [Monoraphidium neglectum]